MKIKIKKRIIMINKEKDIENLKKKLKRFENKRRKNKD